uniref:Telomeric repeat binding factor (NIMA-interacting) 1 n=1 Tax=Myripristis murdjan TaxID=586833 RepID=A0A667ZVL1_9TELE
MYFIPTDTINSPSSDFIFKYMGAVGRQVTPARRKRAEIEEFFQFQTVNTNMETETTDKSAEISSTAEKSVGFSQVKAVATAWMLDFSFVCLCRHFKDGELDEFNQILSAFRGNLVAKDPWPPLPSSGLRRNMTSLRYTFQLLSAFTSVELMLMYSVPEARFWTGHTHTHTCNSSFCPQNIRVKLSTVVTQRDTYHPFLLSFSFSRLLETVQSFLDAYLEKNPSDYLLQVRGRRQSHVHNVGRSAPLVTDVVPPRSKMSQQKVSGTKKRSFRKWTYKLDKNLKDGVKRHGTGKWSLILQEYDFEGRTGTMLKDRWRVLVRAQKVS